MWGKAPSRSDFKWAFPRNCEGTEQLRIKKAGIYCLTAILPFKDSESKPVKVNFVCQDADRHYFLLDSHIKAVYFCSKTDIM